MPLINKNTNTEMANRDINPIARFRNNIFDYYFKSKKVLPRTPSEKDASSVDITTYIRCLFHDFRGPLNNISLGIDVLMESEDRETEQYNILKSVKDSCLFLSESLDGFLNVRKNGGHLNEFIEINYQPFNIIGLVKKLQYILLFTSMKKNIKIKYNIKPIKEWVIGDYKNIQHVLLNLMTNAIKYSNNDTTIIVQLEGDGLIKKKQHIIVSVIDQNNYIEPEIKNHLFEKYNTSNIEMGTGLGLYICKKIVELHGGEISHFNNDGRIKNAGGNPSDKDMNCGNIFQVELFLDVCPSSNNQLDKLVSKRKNAIDLNIKPDDNDNKMDMIKYTNITDKPVDDSTGGNSKILLETKKEESVNKRFMDSNNSKNKSVVNIMVVDDSDISRKLLARLLQHNCKNVKVYDAIDGIDALLKTVEFNEKLNDEISMMLLDNVMPNLTGELLSKILRRIGYTGMIIGITGNGLEEDKEKFIENGADFVFVKPFTKVKLEILLDLISRDGYESKIGKKLYNRSGKLVWE
jgi:CheY-like chemotaxis protein